MSNNPKDTHSFKKIWVAEPRWSVLIPGMEVFFAAKEEIHQGVIEDNKTISTDGIYNEITLASGVKVTDENIVWQTYVLKNGIGEGTTFNNNVD